MGWPGHRAALAFFALVIGAWLVTMAVLMRQASLPPTASGKMLVVFEPGLSNDEVFARVTSAGARPIRASAFPFIWIVSGDSEGLAGRLAEQGAIGAYHDLPLSPTLAGCFAFADAEVRTVFSP